LEKYFERRIQKILEGLGYVVINVAMPKFGGHLIDLIAIKDQGAYPIEIKAKNTPYPKAQEENQKRVFSGAKTAFFLIRQSKRRGKLTVSVPNMPDLKPNSFSMVRALMKLGIVEAC
jgi:Holliday junction resolvase